VNGAWARSCREREKGSGGRRGSISRRTTLGGNEEGHRRLQSCLQSIKLVSKQGLKFLFLGFNLLNHFPLYFRFESAKLTQGDATRRGVVQGWYMTRAGGAQRHRVGRQWLWLACSLGKKGKKETCHWTKWAGWMGHTEGRGNQNRMGLEPNFVP
jgi:hypothetical protein